MVRMDSLLLVKVDLGSVLGHSGFQFLHILKGCQELAHIFLDSKLDSGLQFFQDSGLGSKDQDLLDSKQNSKHPIC